MSTHVIPGTAREAGWASGPVVAGSVRMDLQTERQRIATRAYLLSFAFVRAPSELTDDGTNMVLTFVPNLTAPETTTLTRLLRVASASMEITPAEYTVIEGDIDGLVTFQNLATPTLAQTVLAVKAQSRILKALLRS